MEVLVTKYHQDWDGNVIMDDHGDPIPLTVCICHASSLIDCVCGAWNYPNDYEELNHG